MRLVVIRAEPPQFASRSLLHPATQKVGRTMPPLPYRMQQAGKTLVLALAFAASTSSASATVFTGSTTDPADRPTDPARDIKQILTSFDNVSGRWVGDVEFYGSPSPSTIAKVYRTCQCRHEA